MAAVLAFDQRCARGCRHFAPRLVRTVVLPYRRKPDDFYVWMFIEDARNSKWFSHVTIQRVARRMSVSIQMVTSEMASFLERTSGQSYDPAFNECATTYEIEPASDANGRAKTLVTFSTAIGLSGAAAIFGGTVAENRLKEAAVAVRRDLSSVKADQRLP